MSDLNLTTVRQFTPSPQQADALQWAATGTGSAIVRAVAGAGKTTLLIEMIKVLKGTIGFVSFSKRIVEEIRAKVSRIEDSSVTDRVTIETMHAVGFRAVRAAYPHVKTEGRGWKEKKNYIIAESLQIPESHRAFAFAAVSKAKNVGIGATVRFSDRQEWLDMVDHFDLADMLPEDGGVSLTDALRSACLILKESIRICNQLIDFDDMIYIPVLKGLRVAQFDCLLNDEAQDTNLMRLALARMMLLPGGRMVAVGDDAQAIFGFTGADSNALNRIETEFNAINLPLTVSYRCPQSVVAVAQEYVPGIESAPDAPMGNVATVTELEFMTDYASTLDRNDFVLCRNTKPLVSLAYTLLGRGIGCLIEGKDIGTGLKRLATKWKRVKTVGALRAKLDDYRESETNKAMAKGQEYKAESLNDRIDCLLVIMGQMTDDSKISDIETKIDSMFGDVPEGGQARVCTLSTIHKSKGRERPRVFWYGPNEFQPSKFARQDWQMIQERNLSYVAATRAQETLIIVTTATKGRNATQPE